MSNKNRNTGFQVKNYTDIFKSTDTDIKIDNSEVVILNIENLIPYANHPFKLYEGKQFENMVESIKANNVIVPIIVRPYKSMLNTYEILSGHNRVEASKFLSIETIPAIIKTDLDDNDALLVVTETNLAQRSFADLSHSERAIVIKTHVDAIKQQGKRNDLINEINNLLNTDKTKENETSGKIAISSNSRDIAAEKYGLDARNISRYIRLSELNESILNKVDDNQIAFNPAVLISYLSIAEQTELNRILDEKKYKIDMKKAELLREFSENNKLTSKIISDILTGAVSSVKKKNRASLPVQSLKIRGKILSKYFKPEQKPSEIETEIIQALEFYRAHKNSDEK